MLLRKTRKSTPATSNKQLRDRLKPISDLPATRANFGCDRESFGDRDKVIRCKSAATVPASTWWLQHASTISRNKRSRTLRALAERSRRHASSRLHDLFRFTGRWEGCLRAFTTCHAHAIRVGTVRHNRPGNRSNLDRFLPFLTVTQQRLRLHSPGSAPIAMNKTHGSSDRLILAVRPLQPNLPLTSTSPRAHQS